MAFRSCFFLSMEIGTGTRFDPYRSSLTAHIKGGPGVLGFTDLINKAQEIRFAYAETDEVFIAAAELDPRNTRLSPLFTSRSDVRDWLETARAFDVATLRRKGIDVGAMATNRLALSRIYAHHAMIQRLGKVFRRAAIPALFKRDLETNGAVTVAEKSEVLTKLGMDLGAVSRHRPAIEALRKSRTWGRPPAFQAFER